MIINFLLNEIDIILMMKLPLYEIIDINYHMNTYIM